MNPKPNQTDNPEIPTLSAAGKGLLLLKREIATYRRELPRLLAEGHEGRFVLIKGDQVISIWDTFDDAHEAGAERFGLDIFLAQPIESRYLTAIFPRELDANEPA